MRVLVFVGADGNALALNADRIVAVMQYTGTIVGVRAAISMGEADGPYLVQETMAEVLGRITGNPADLFVDVVEGKSRKLAPISPPVGEG